MPVLTDAYQTLDRDVRRHAGAYIIEGLDETSSPPRIQTELSDIFLFPFYVFYNCSPLSNLHYFHIIFFQK